MRTLCVILAVQALALSACGDGSGLESDSCAELSGREFRSVSAYECGGCPGGLIPCHWIVEFETDLVRWSHSDVIERRSYECREEGALFETGSDDPLGHYDHVNDQLTWDGLAYEPCTGECDPEYGACGDL